MWRKIATLFHREGHLCILCDCKNRTRTGDRQLLQADPTTHIANISVQSCHAVNLEETTPFSRCLACGMLASPFSAHLLSTGVSAANVLVQPRITVQHLRDQFRISTPPVCAGRRHRAPHFGHSVACNFFFSPLFSDCPFLRFQCGHALQLPAASSPSRHSEVERPVSPSLHTARPGMRLSSGASCQRTSAKSACKAFFCVAPLLCSVCIKVVRVSLQTPGVVTAAL